ncbi:MAG: diadenylate cyclase CdaA [Armatimonadota bacterium]|nr:diadenylate cyclase CdaA [bacterium]
MNIFHLLSACQKYLASAGWTTIFSTFLDIFLVTALVYWLIMLSKRTRAWHIIWGLLIFIFLVPVTDWLHLQTLNYILHSFLPLGPVAIVILFFPEIRHWLENMGRFAGLGVGLASMDTEDRSSLIQVVVRAACRMSEKQIGALIVIEREGALDDIAATGTRLDSHVSEELIGTIFNPGSPLHDGAIIIRGNRIIAAGCTLPLSESAHVGTMIHTRHKAALGVAEESDAAVVVVSEETGTISLALEGKLHRGLNEESLTRRLKNLSGMPDERGEHKSQFARLNGTIRKARSRLK